MSLKSPSLFLLAYAVLLILTCAFAGCSSSKIIISPPQEPNVTITDTGFIPEYIEVKPGTTVTWTNTGFYPHSISSDIVGDLFHSPTLKPGDSYQHTYFNLGNQPYFDGISRGKMGAVQVVK